MKFDQVIKIFILVLLFIVLISSGIFTRLGHLENLVERLYRQESNQSTANLGDRSTGQSIGQSTAKSTDMPTANLGDKSTGQSTANLENQSTG